MIREVNKHLKLQILFALRATLNCVQDLFMFLGSAITPGILVFNFRLATGERNILTTIIWLRTLINQYITKKTHNFIKKYWPYPLTKLTTKTDTKILI